MTIQLPGYSWRGRTYKTLRGLHGAALKVHPECGLSFRMNAMVLSLGRGSERIELHYARHFDVNHISIIADHPV